MSIQIECPCGQKSVAKDKLRGKTIACPKCGQKLLVGSNSLQASGRAGATILATCQCGKRLSVPAKLAGQRVNCPGCGEAVAVPDGTKAPTPVEQLFDEEGINASAVYSPDGRRIALTRSEKGDADIWVLDAKTGASIKSPERRDEAPPSHKLYQLGFRSLYWGQIHQVTPA